MVLARKVLLRNSMKSVERTAALTALAVGMNDSAARTYSSKDYRLAM